MEPHEMSVRFPSGRQYHSGLCAFGASRPQPKELLMSFRILLLLFGMTLATTAYAEQFVLFDEAFTFEEKDAVPTQSHLMVKAEQFGKDTPKDWTQPVDYRNGTVHIRFEVIEKPAGETPTMWSLCYIPNKGQKNNYGCASSPTYTVPGVFEKDEDMTKFWENDSIIWTDGIKMMTLVIKAAKVQGKTHAHLQPDLTKFFPTKIRVIMVQVSKGATYDPSKVPGLKAEKK
jgi:hypothetical protein